jgi:uncharacterized membrane protein
LWFEEDMNFDFFNPWALLFLLVIPFLLWVARKSFADLTGTRAKVLLGVRIAAVALVAGALTHVLLSFTKSDVPVGAIFCVDASDSVSDETLASAQAFIRDALESKKSDDQAGVVLFGAKGSVVLPPGRTVNLPGLGRGVDGSNTDVAGALRLGMLELPKGVQKRLVLLSDGYETRGDARLVAAEAAALDVRLDTVSLASGRSHDVAVADLTCAAFVKRSQTFEVSARVMSTEAVAAPVKLFLDDMAAPAQTKPVDLKPGKNLVTFQVQIPKEGPHALKVTADAPGDTNPRNDSASTLVKVGPKPSVLVVATNPDDALYLAAALRTQEFDLRIDSPENFPSYAPGASRRDIAAAMKKLFAYDVIVVSNVPAKSWTREQMLLINSYVYDFGGGLIMVGGKDGFGTGGYYKTPIELALPVYTDPLREAPVYAVVLIMDKSWSMGDPQKGGISKIDMVKETTIAAVEHLTKKDHLAVISFDTETHTIVPMQRAEDIPAKVKEISARESFGLTNFYPALIEAQKILKNTNADYKHAVFISDGRPSGEGKDYEGQLTKMKNDHIIVSAVAIGVDADKKLMNNIAAWGKGQYYYTADVKALPDIMLKETGRIKELLLVEGPFKPRSGPHPYTPILKGIDIDAMPVVLGFNRSRPKETAQVEIIVSAKDEPLLASWRYGAGSAVAFTSDARNIWGAQWVGGWRDGFSKFWRQVVLGTIQLRRGEIDYRLALDRAPGETRIVLDAADRNGRFVSGQSLKAEVIAAAADGTGVAPATEQKLKLEQAAPGRYDAKLKVAADRPLLVRVLDPSDDELYVDSSVAAAAPEYLTVGTDDLLLGDLRQATGGKIVRPSDVFVRAAATSVQLREIDYVLLFLATLLFAADVFVRRMPALMRLLSGKSQAT